MNEPNEENLWDLLPVHHYTGTIRGQRRWAEPRDALILLAVLAIIGWLL